MIVNCQANMNVKETDLLSKTGTLEKRVGSVGINRRPSGVLIVPASWNNQQAPV